MRTSGIGTRAVDGDSPIITVVIPTHNRQSTLAARALPAALAQEHVTIEVLVVDDGSEPAVTVPTDRRIRVLRHAVRRGVAAARNTGLRAAQGEWIAFLDDDDIWSPAKLRLQLSALASGGDFCYSSGVVLDRAFQPLRSAPAPCSSGLLSQLLGRNVMPAGPSNVMVRRALLRDLGGFDESFSHLDDWDCWLRLADGHAARRLDMVLVAYILGADSRVHRDADRQWHEFERLDTKHASLQARLGHHFDRHDFSRYVAVAHRRANHPGAAARVYLESAWRYRSMGDVVRAGAALARLPPRRSRRLDVPDWVAAYVAGLNK